MYFTLHDEIHVRPKIDFVVKILVDRPRSERWWIHMPTHDTLTLIREAHEFPCFFIIFQWQSHMLVGGIECVRVHPVPKWIEWDTRASRAFCRQLTPPVARSLLVMLDPGRGNFSDTRHSRIMIIKVKGIECVIPFSSLLSHTISRNLNRRLRESKVTKQNYNYVYACLHLPYILITPG